MTFDDLMSAIRDGREELSLETRHRVALHEDDETAFGMLVRSARSARVEICAQGSPFAAKDVLKTRGYRWFDGSDGGPKCWRIDVLEDVVESEVRFLRERVYRSDATIPCRRLDATTRYR